MAEPLPGETIEQFRLRSVELKVDALDDKVDRKVDAVVVKIDNALDQLGKIGLVQQQIINSTALRDSRASTLRVTLLGVAVAAVLTVVGAVIVNIITAAGHLATTGVPTP